MSFIERRSFLGAAMALGASAILPGASGANDGEWLFGTTPVFLDDHVALLNEWGDFLRRRMNVPIRFVQRRSYRDITELVLAGKVDAAWVCGAPYVQNRDRMQLVAVPLFNGEPLYRSYVIVGRATGIPDLRSLKGRNFAYADPDSNSGHHVPRHRILGIGENPSTFFARTFFTYSHRKVIEAVAAGLADGGAVDGYVWESLAARSPSHVERTVVVDRSEQYGFPPIVAPRGVDSVRLANFAKALLDMSVDGQGRAMLKRLNLTGFAREPESLFGGIANVLKELHALA